jgi:uncharacterized repeat protein (TIGR03803 family)
LSILTIILTIVPIVQAQTFTVLYNFAGGPDGYFPSTPLTIDRSGNLYGTANLGGNDNDCVVDQFRGCGTLFKLSRHGSAWTFNVLYSFLGGSDGAYPETAVVFGPDGSLYGTTGEGGTNGCFAEGCGTVFKLQPPPTFCPAFSCAWTKTTLYQFTGGYDGGKPLGSPSFDHAGNLYGTTEYTGQGSPAATVYELTPSNGGWKFSIVYSFPDNGQAATPYDGVVFDPQGNIWATTYYGGIQDCGDPQLPNSCGIIFELIPSGSGWTENTVFQFHRSIGGGPTGNLIFDQSGNLYGTLQANGPNGGGSVYQLNPSSQAVTVLASLPGSGGTVSGPTGNLVMDAAGNLYGVTEGAGAHNLGSIFKLSPSSGGWILTDLHDFSGASDGSYPYAGLVIDANGNLYGTTTEGGNSSNCYNGCGTIFEITP